MHKHTKDIRKSSVEDIMTKDFQKVHKDTSIGEVIEAFERHDTECLPVVDDEDNFLGDVHKRDLIKLAIDPKHMSEHDIIGFMGTKIDESYFAEDVKDIMETHEITADPDTNVEEVVLEMWKEEVRSVPITRGEKIIGVVFEDDIISKVVEKIKKVEE